MRLLGIESSCDETAIALVRGEGEVVEVQKSLVSSQIDIHKAFGGVVPEVAARRHVDVIFPMLTEAGIPHDGKGIDAISVTAGPGLVAALRVGVELAKTLAWIWKKPLVAANHLEGHVYSTWIGTQDLRNAGTQAGMSVPKFPALALLVSGGHTELILMRDHGQYEILGMTRDDAAGEAFDKVAKLLGLEYPGGPKISKLAKEGNSSAIDFPRPMLDSGDFDFSFSGLKTAVSVYLKSTTETHPRRGNPPWLPTGVSIADICASFERAVVDVLIAKTLMAAKKINPKSILLVGGVAANTRLREDLATAVAKAFPATTFHVPPLDLTGDNAAMIAAAGYFRARVGKTADPLTLSADPNFSLGQ